MQLINVTKAGVIVTNVEEGSTRYYTNIKESCDIQGKEIQVGDTVKVVYGGKELDEKFGWDNTWTSRMDEFVGQEYKVEDLYGSRGVTLRKTNPDTGAYSIYNFPWFCLEVIKQEKKEEKMETKTRHHHAIAKAYFADSEVVCEVKTSSGWIKCIDPQFIAECTYRLLAKAENTEEFVMYRHGEAALASAVEVEQYKQAGWKVVHTENKPNWTVLMQSEGLAD